MAPFFSIYILLRVILYVWMSGALSDMSVFPGLRFAHPGYDSSYILYFS